MALVVSSRDLLWVGHPLTQFEAVRIRYDPTVVTYAGQGNTIRAAIFLGRCQIDLAVEPNGLDLVRQRFTTFNHLRLLSSDPLFLLCTNRPLCTD